MYKRTFQSEMDYNNSCGLSASCTGYRAIHTEVSLRAAIARRELTRLQEQQHNDPTPHTPKRSMPCEWPEDTDDTRPSQKQELGSATSSSTPSTIFHRFGSAVKRVVTSPARNLQYLFPQHQIVTHNIVREDGARKRRYIHAGIAGAPGRVLSPARTIEDASQQVATSHANAIASGALSSDSAISSSSWETATASAASDEASSWRTPASLSTLSTFPARSASSSLETVTRDSVSQRSAITRKNSISNLRSAATTQLVRRGLIKNQLKVTKAHPGPAIPSGTTSHTTSNTISTPLDNHPTLTLNIKDTIAQAKDLEARIQARNQATTQTAAEFRARAEARAKCFAEHRKHNFRAGSPSTKEANTWDYLRIIDIIDAYRTPSPVPEVPAEPTAVQTSITQPTRKTVRWTNEAEARPFYSDERVGVMHDSHFEHIIFTPTRRHSTNHDSDSSSTTSSARIDLWLDPSIYGDEAELEPSRELSDDLHEQFQAKLLLEPPKPAHIRLVTPPTSEESDQLSEAAAKTMHGLRRDMVVVEPELKAHDFSTLLPDMFNGDSKAWLNDNIVNEYLSILVAQKKKEAGFEGKRDGPAPPVHAFSSYWYTTAKNNLSSTSRWATRARLGGAKLLDVELLLFPICDSGHWRLLAVKPKAREIEYLDSLGFDGSKYVSKMKEFLHQELKDLFVEEEWAVLGPQRSSRQMNGSDCGVFTALNAVCLLRGEDFDKVLPLDGMFTARERIALTLLARSPTAEYE